MGKTLAVSLVIGAALGRRYFSTFDIARTRAQKPGSATGRTDQKLRAAKGLVHYKTLLAERKEKQRQAGGSSRRLADGIETVERKYQSAKRAAKGYGLEIGQVIGEQKRPTPESKKLDRQLSRLNHQQSVDIVKITAQHVSHNIALHLSHAFGQAWPDARYGYIQSRLFLAFARPGNLFGLILFNM